LLPPVGIVSAVTVVVIIVDGADVAGRAGKGVTVLAVKVEIEVVVAVLVESCVVVGG